MKIEHCENVKNFIFDTFLNLLVLESLCKIFRFFRFFTKVYLNALTFATSCNNESTWVLDRCVKLHLVGEYFLRVISLDLQHGFSLLHLQLVNIVCCIHQQVVIFIALSIYYLKLKNLSRTNLKPIFGYNKNIVFRPPFCIQEVQKPTF